MILQMDEPIKPSERGIDNIVAKNLQLNFPRHEIAIPFEESEITFSPNFRKIAEKVNKMPDTFGLCGVLAVTANGLLANRERWQDVDYNPDELKTMFDKWWPTRQGDSAWMWFDKTHKNKFKEGPNDFAVLTDAQLNKVTPRLDELKLKRAVFDHTRWKDALKAQQANRFVTNPDEKLDLIAVTTPSLSNVFDQLEDNEGVDIAVLCEYPIQKGTHTHWLAARKQSDRGKVLIAGDLKPFGIPAIGISVPIEDTLRAMDRVIGSSPTTNLTSALAESNKNDRGLHNDKMFLMNFVRRKF